MKQYEPVQIFIMAFHTYDVVRTSNQGAYEGVSDLNPTTRPDWFN